MPNNNNSNRNNNNNGRNGNNNYNRGSSNQGWNGGWSNRNGNNYSNGGSQHFCRDPSERDAVADFLRERRLEEQNRPFREMSQQFSTGISDLVQALRPDTAMPQAPVAPAPQVPQVPQPDQISYGQLVQGLQHLSAQVSNLQQASQTQAAPATPATPAAQPPFSSLPPGMFDDSIRRAVEEALAHAAPTPDASGSSAPRGRRKRAN